MAGPAVGGHPTVTRRGSPRRGPRLAWPPSFWPVPSEGGYRQRSADRPRRALGPRRCARRSLPFQPCCDCPPTCTSRWSATALQGCPTRRAGCSPATAGDRRGHAMLPDPERGRLGALYTVDPLDHLQADRDAEAHGLEIIGVFHSHTHTDAYPVADRRRPGARPRVALRARLAPGHPPGGPELLASSTAQVAEESVVVRPGRRALTRTLRQRSDARSSDGCPSPAATETSSIPETRTTPGIGPRRVPTGAGTIRTG